MSLLSRNHCRIQPGHSDPKMGGGGGVQSPKIVFGPSGLSWSKTKEETRAPRGPPLDPPQVISPIVGTGIPQTVKRNQDRAQSGP